jgi:hypothetical protein
MTLFEAPATHESTHYEFENEWEMPEATQYSNPYSNPEFESEWEMQETAHYSNPEFENEWEMQETTQRSPKHFMLANQQYIELDRSSFLLVLSSR